MKTLRVLMLGLVFLYGCGDSHEANRLGLKYLKGNGVTQDYARALKYFSHKENPKPKPRVS